MLCRESPWIWIQGTFPPWLVSTVVTYHCWTAFRICSWVSLSLSRWIWVFILTRVHQCSHALDIMCNTLRVLIQIFNPHQMSDGIFTDYCDGPLFYYKYFCIMMMQRWLRYTLIAWVYISPNYPKSAHNIILLAAYPLLSIFSVLEDMNNSVWYLPSVVNFKVKGRAFSPTPAKCTWISPSPVHLCMRISSVVPRERSLSTAKKR